MILDGGRDSPARESLRWHEIVLHYFPMTGRAPPSMPCVWCAPLPTRGNLLSTRFRLSDALLAGGQLNCAPDTAPAPQWSGAQLQPAPLRPPIIASQWGSPRCSSLARAPSTNCPKASRNRCPHISSVRVTCYALRTPICDLVLSPIHRSPARSVER